MSLQEIVNVIIHRESTAVSQQGFGTLLIVGPNAIFAERLRYYTNAADMLADGFIAGNPEYIAAMAALSQQPRPVRVAIGRKAGGETWVDALSAIQAEQDDWYALVITSRTQADVEAVAAWVESRKKLFVSASADAGVLAATVVDVAGVLRDAGYARTAILYHQDAATLYPEAAWVGHMLPYDPGTATWKFKTLAGVALSPLTTTQSTNARNKDANVYQRIGGVNISREGTVAEGEYIDVIQGIDWLTARIMERIYSRLVNLSKVPFTDAGIAVIEAELRAQLSQAVNVGFLAKYEVTVPKAKDISANDKALRQLTGVTFGGTLAGAIHVVTVVGTIVV